jgi:hypothetical protein
MDSVKASLDSGEEVCCKISWLELYHILIAFVCSCLGTKKVKPTTQSFLQFHLHTKSAEQNVLAFICLSMMTF